MRGWVWNPGYAGCPCCSSNLEELHRIGESTSSIHAGHALWLQRPWTIPTAPPAGADAFGTRGGEDGTSFRMANSIEFDFIVRFWESSQTCANAGMDSRV